MKAFLGEVLGTFVMVSIGCGAVSVAVLFGWLNLLGVALVFGGGVTLGILVSRKWSYAHLNPAVSFAFLMKGDITWKNFVSFVIAQHIGAFLAAVVLIVIFNDAILSFEVANEIIRGEANSFQSAVMFGEFYPNPGFPEVGMISTVEAMLFEVSGTFILMTVIFQLLKSDFHRNLIPILIGLTVTALILLIAPYTQGGFNPARDFAPRIVAYMSGWGEAAFPHVSFGFLVVYIAGPVIGATISALGFGRVFPRLKV